MANFIHFDEANTAATSAVRCWLQKNTDVEAMLVTDLHGLMRLVVFKKISTDLLEQQLKSECGAWWSGEVVQAALIDEVSRNVYVNAYSSARIDDQEPKLRLLQRHRSRTAWFSGPASPPWQAPENGPPVIVFYSFKGGLGRSTLLASFALQRARAGERVCVIDMDLDSPGAGRLLAADRDGLIASWGVVDFLLEHRLQDLRFDDYWHRCDRVAGDGEVRVMPSGRLDSQFADKLARVDLEEVPSADESGIWKLLQRAHRELEPDWILLDARTGISEPAGQLLSGIAHLHVLIGSFQEQSWLGLDRVLDRLGRDRILTGRPQAEVLLVQAMVPAAEPGKWAKESFNGRAEVTFEERYYAASESDPEELWTIDDKESDDAPHVPVPIDYDARLASFSDIEDVADTLTTGAYVEVATRITNRFLRVESI